MSRKNHKLKHFQGKITIKKTVHYCHPVWPIKQLALIDMSEADKQKYSNEYNTSFPDLAPARFLKHFTDSFDRYPDTGNIQLLSHKGVLFGEALARIGGRWATTKGENPCVVFEQFGIAVFPFDAVYYDSERIGISTEGIYNNLWSCFRLLEEKQNALDSTGNQNEDSEFIKSCITKMRHSDRVDEVSIAVNELNQATHQHLPG